MKTYATLAFFLLPLVCDAQEIRCTQAFMNKSERAICGSDDLIQQDSIVGTLSRRAKVLDLNYPRENRSFRSSLKRCEGEISCLTGVYTERIEYLQNTLDNGRVLTEKEGKEIASRDDRASKKFESQEETREKYAAQLAEKKEITTNVTQELETDSLQPQPDSTVAEEESFETQERETAPGVNEALPKEEHANIQIVNSEINDLLTAIVALIREHWIISGVIFLVILSVIKSIINSIVGRCPRCKKWWARKYISSDSSASTEYETRAVDEVHKNRHGREVGRTSRQQQFAVGVTNTRSLCRCKFCRHEWVEHSQSRS